MRFPPEIAKIYYLSWMPFRPEPLHVLAILAVGMLLVLLASVFFSGFVLPISEFNGPVRAGAYLIPVTSGISLIQDVMLRGEIREPWQAMLLAAISLVLLLACWLLLRRNMTRA